MAYSVMEKLTLDEINIVRERFNRRLLDLENVDAVMQCIESTESEEGFCMYYLYAVMPSEDLNAKGPYYFLGYVRQILKSMTESSWGQEVPIKLFLGYILVYRVNNEKLSPYYAYGRFKELLDSTIRGKDMMATILAINNFAGHYVKYRPTDEFTSSPWVIFRRGYGRCGEESTLVVLLMRLVGIPARQIYVPRWSHCDDNHAWVEVWFKGKWHYLGACEPETVLNRGWFSKAATRAMLIHTPVYSLFQPQDEDILVDEERYYVLNRTRFYAETQEVVLQLVDESDQIIHGGKVDFQVYNYGNFVTIFSTISDAQGRVKVHLGFGDIIIQISKNIWSQTLTLDTSKLDGVRRVICKKDNCFDAVTTGILKAPEERALKVSETKSYDLSKSIGDYLECEEYSNECVGMFYPQEYECILILLHMAKGNRQALHDFLIAIKDRRCLTFLKEVREKAHTEWSTDEYLSTYRQWLGKQKAILKLVNIGNQRLNYKRDWSISRLCQGRFTDLDIEDSQLGSCELELDPGHYRIVVGGHLPRGDVYYREYHVELDSMTNEELDIELPAISLGDYLINKKLSYMNTSVTENYDLLIWLDMKLEPSHHFINEFHEVKEQFKKMGLRMMFYVKSPDQLMQLEHAMVGYEYLTMELEETGIAEKVCRALYVEPDQNPLALIFHKHRCRYVDVGYRVGSVEQILRICQEVYREN